MGGVIAAARAVLRTRWPAVVGLAAMVTVAFGVVLAGAAGARRTATALDRWVDEQNVSQLTVFSGYNDVVADPVRRARVLDGLTAAVEDLDGVVQAAPVVGYVAIADGMEDGLSLGSAVDRRAELVDRPGLVEGRLPRDDAVDEVFLSETAVDRSGLGVGDRIEVQTITAATFAPVLRGELSEADMAALRPDGPLLDLEIVGTGRLTSELDGDPFQDPVVFTAPAFHERYRDDLAMSAVAVQLVTDGTVTEDAVRGAVERADLGAEVGISDSTDLLDDLEGNNRVIATGIAIFTAVAALGAAFTVAQAVARLSSLSVDVDRVGGELGMTRTQRTAAVAAPALVAVVAGAVGAWLVAVALSPLFPLSQAERTEPNPGVSIDVPVLGAAFVVVVVLGGSACVWGARRARPAATERAPRRSLLRISSGERALTASLGGRMALSRGASPGLATAQSAVGAAVVGIAGLVGLGVVLASLTETMDSPERSGATWSSQPDLLSTDPEATAVALAGEDGIAAAAERRCLEVLVDGQVTGACALRPLVGATPPVLTAGRAPAGSGEVALTRTAMHDHRVDIGDRIVGAATTGEDVPLTVVGQVVMPNVGDYEGLFQNGDALVDYGDLERLRRPETGTDTGRVLLLTYEEDVDAAALEQRLVADYDGQVEFPEWTRPGPPARVYLLDLLRPWIVGLGLFLGGLACVGLLQHLTVTARRRRSDFAVLRCLGLRRGQVRSAVSWQAVVTTVAGLVVGVPLGIVVGRVAWRITLSGLDIIDTPATPWLLVALLPVVAIAGATALAVIPGWVAARRRPADALRTE